MENPVGNMIQDHDEVPLVVHSNVVTPIKELTFLQKSLLFAELAMIAYNDEAEATVAAAMAGFPDVTFYDRDGSQAFRFRNDFDCVIACRGTEPNEWNDIKADANARSTLAETAGKVHRGFKREVDDLWPMIETALIDNYMICGSADIRWGGRWRPSLPADVTCPTSQATRWGYLPTAVRVGEINATSITSSWTTIALSITTTSSHASRHRSWVIDTAAARFISTVREGSPS